MDDLYRQQFMDYYKNPQYKGVLDDVSVSAYEKNQFCGDELTLYLKIKDDIITGVSYEGEACAVSIAASELVAEEILDKNIAQAMQLTKENILEMLGTDLTTSRIKCATLVLQALKKALKGYEIGKEDIIKFEELKVELPITKDTNLGLLANTYPDAAEVLLDYGLHCVHCIASAFDTVETGAKLHGYDDDEIAELVDRVNEVIEHGE